MTHLVAATRSDRRILAIVEPVARGMGYEIVRLRLGGGERKSLQVLAERDDGRMDIDDCARLSRALSVELDVRDPIAGGYSLEISSPGIDRPLTRPGHFQTWLGHEVRIEAEGRKLRGRLSRADGNAITLACDEGEVAVDFAMIRKARLVLSDALLQAGVAGGDADG